MKVRVDGRRCTGHGRCYTVAPGVFEPDAEGFNAGRDIFVDVPPEQEEAALRGERSCPEQAITVIDDE